MGEGHAHVSPREESSRGQTEPVPAQAERNRPLYGHCRAKACRWCFALRDHRADVAGRCER